VFKSGNEWDAVELISELIQFPIPQSALQWFAELQLIKSKSCANPSYQDAVIREDCVTFGQPCHRGFPAF
jgi:hypothetical protein